MMEIQQNKLAIKQLVETIELFTNLEARNKYSICDEAGAQVFFAYEESGFFGRQFWGRLSEN